MFKNLARIMPAAWLLLAAGAVIFGLYLPAIYAAVLAVYAELFIARLDRNEVTQ